jgi:FKBP-type peptidyl-prolyl cis-trans isomerase
VGGNEEKSNFCQLVISLNLVLAGLRLGLKNRKVGEKWVLMIVPIYAKVSNKDNTKNLEQLLLDKNYCF